MDVFDVYELGSRMQIVPGNDIEERFSALASDVFGLSIATYLAANHGRQLFGYAIDLPTRSFFPLFITGTAHRRVDGNCALQKRNRLLPSTSQ